jgi:hypothetical protein
LAAHQIATQGYLVVIFQAPLNPVVLDPTVALELITGYPEILCKPVGVHWLGGSMAANYALSHLAFVQGLVLSASSPASSDTLSSSGMKGLSVSSTLDGLSTPAKIQASLTLFAADTTFIPIEGGNHAQLGWYGSQPGDNHATITRKTPKDQIVRAILDFLGEFMRRNHVCVKSI